MFTRSYYFLLSLTLMGAFASCNKELDLDKETLIKIEKQEKLVELDKIYDLAFTDPKAAEGELSKYTRDELITDTHNFLTNTEVNNSYSFTKLAIQLNLQQQALPNQDLKHSLFATYKARYESDLSNRTLYGSIPEQLKMGDKLKRFEDKMAEIKTSYESAIKAFESSNPLDKSIAKEWEGVLFAYKSDFSVFYNLLYDFSLNSDKSWDYESFSFMPAIPKVGAMAGVQFERELDKSDIVSKLHYETYGDRIFFQFHIRNNYDYETQTGKLERMWCYEYKYQLKDGKLLLSEPRILYYMFPTMIAIAFDDPLYKTNYLEAFSGFEKELELSVKQ